jgi:hypothetical protein
MTRREPEGVAVDEGNGRRVCRGSRVMGGLRSSTRIDEFVRAWGWGVDGTGGWRVCETDYSLKKAELSPLLPLGVAVGHAGGEEQVYTGAVHTPLGGRGRYI